MNSSIISDWKRELQKLTDIVVSIHDAPWIKCTQNFRPMPAASGSNYIRNFEPNLIVFCKKPSLAPGDAKDGMNSYFPFASCPWMDFSERFTMHRMRLTANEIPYLDMKYKVPWNPERDGNRSEKSLAYAQVVVSILFRFNLCSAKTYA